MTVPAGRHNIDKDWDEIRSFIDSSTGVDIGAIDPEFADRLRAALEDPRPPQRHRRCTNERAA